VIFIKLNFEVERASLAASLLIIATIGINYILIELMSVESIGKMLDPDLPGVATRSIFNFSAFAMTIGVCGTIVMIEYMLYYLRICGEICRKERKKVDGSGKGDVTNTGGKGG